MKNGDIEIRMLMLGATLVGTNPKAAAIVAEAMAEIERLRKQVRQLKTAKKKA